MFHATFNWKELGSIPTGYTKNTFYGDIVLVTIRYYTNLVQLKCLIKDIKYVRIGYYTIWVQYICNTSHTTFNWWTLGTTPIRYIKNILDRAIVLEKWILHGLGTLMIFYFFFFFFILIQPKNDVWPKRYIVKKVHHKIRALT